MSTAIVTKAVVTRAIPHATENLGRVTVTLTLRPDNELAFKTAFSSTVGPSVIDIMAARTKLIHERAKEALVGARRAKTPLPPEDVWRYQGLIRKGKSGDFNFPNGLLTLTNNPRLKGGVANGDPEHYPIVLYAENGESLEWEIDNYNGDFIVVVTGDPSMPADVFKNTTTPGFQNIGAPRFQNIFDKEVFPSNNGGSAVSGPAVIRDPNYVFFKYNVILLDTPFAIHDPDVLCGTPIGK
jgi:hypothetical protein